MSGQVHSEELERAMERAAVGPDLELVCESAHGRAVTLVVDGQFADPDRQTELARQALVDAGEPNPRPEMAEYVAMRASIAGAFSFGLRVGLEIARARGWGG